MSRRRTLQQSLVASHFFVSLLPLVFIAVIMLIFLFRNVREDSMVKIAMLSQGTKGQIELFMEQPLIGMENISGLLTGVTDPARVEDILNTHIRFSPYLEAIYLLDRQGKVMNVGLPLSREHYRLDLLGIQLGHKTEFRKVVSTGTPQWSNTFLSLSSGKISLTVYSAAGEQVLAADINLNALAEQINRLSISNVVTMVIDQNGVIIFHPDREMVGKSITANTIDIVRDALAGEERTDEFHFLGQEYVGSTSIIKPAGWVSLIAEPKKMQQQRLIVPLLIFGGGLCGAAILSMLLAFYGSRSLSRPLTEITAKSSVIAGGDYTTTLPKSRFTELEQLSNSISDMVSAIQQRENQLIENEMKYRELVENTSNLVVRLDSECTILYANHTIERLTGWNIAESQGRRLAALMHDDEWQEMQSKILNSAATLKASETHETKIVHRDGTVRNLLLSINMHYGNSGELRDMNIIGHDITVRYQVERQQREMERKSQQSQKMEMLGLMAGGVAHDLNNILAGIINYPELLLLKLDNDDPNRAIIASIKKSGERAAAVVADLLTVARQSASVYKPADVNVLVKECCDSPECRRIQQLYPGVEFAFEPAGNLNVCNCSKSHIEKTVLNLILNAFEAVNGSGAVKVRTENVSAGEIEKRQIALRSGEYVAVTVMDDGPGIVLEEQEKIFEPFFSKKELGRSGTGLGLTVAWSSVKEHGGTITVDSGPLGTIFTVYLPATTDHPVEEIDAVETSELRGNGEHILVVDDEKHIRDIATRMLETLDYKVSSVGSGEEAIRFLQENDVDMLLLDMLMEPGINGRETYEKICHFKPGQRAVVASGFSESREVATVMKLGADLFIKKPYSFADLGRSVARVLSGSEA